MKSFIGAALLSATIATAAPTACTAPSTFQLAAYPANNSSIRNWIQAFDNSGTYNYDFLFSAPGVVQSQASYFSFSPSIGRIATVPSKDGGDARSSIAPAQNQIVKLVSSPSDTSGNLAVKCSPSGVKYLVDTGATKNADAPFLLCQIPGWTTGLTEVYYNPTSNSSNVDNHEGGVYPCIGVGLSLN